MALRVKKPPKSPAAAARGRRAPPPSDDELERIRADQARSARVSMRLEGLLPADLGQVGDDELTTMTRRSLHELGPTVVATIEREMNSGGKAAVAAALGTLDRIGIPPVRKIEVQEIRNRDPATRALQEAATNMALMPVAAICQFIAMLAETKPEIGELLKPAMKRLQAIPDEPMTARGGEFVLDESDYPAA